LNTYGSSFAINLVIDWNPYILLVYIYESASIPLPLHSLKATCHQC
jgi:hypothetical protein